LTFIIELHSTFN